MSNSAGTNDDAEYREAKIVEDALGVPVLRHSAKKPGGFDELTAHYNGALTPDQICIIGDRLFTDVLFGTLHGLLTVHVTQSLKHEGDNVLARAIKALENGILLRLLQGVGVKPIYHPAREKIKK
mmetsp:Transcript_32765/g.63186  ORF Transcript_32765/g.63186 Transcript_32765/m.63186 type:complete len:125 (+) Transcript_32765:27-401(+)